MTIFITEEWLRSQHSLSRGTEIWLPADSRLTPSARALIYERKLIVKYHDDAGRLFIEPTPVGDLSPAADAEPERQPVHALTSESTYQHALCSLCQQAVVEKTDAMTHLNARQMVAKNDPRLLFRARLDSTIAQAVWLQTELGNEPQGWLADIRSVLGNIMRADVLDKPLEDFAIGGLQQQALHRLSHHPLQLLGHDHIVPAVEQGRTVALLNLLRAQIRETEICAAQLFIDQNFQLLRPDIMQGLNRLSSAVYVLMLLCLRLEKGGSWLSTEQLMDALTNGI